MVGPGIVAHHRSVPLVAADLRARIGSGRCPALLGGDRRFGRSGRWSILAADPRLVFESATGLGYEVGSCRSDGDALAGLGALLGRYRLGGDESPDLDPDLPFQGGLIGFLAYDLAPRIEAIPRRAVPGPTTPALRFGLYDTFVLVDHEPDPDRATLWAVDLLGEGEAAVAARLDRWWAWLRQPAPEASGRTRIGPVRPDQAPAAYRARVERAKRYIEAGDIFQVNLTQRFAATGARVDPRALDARLQAISPAPYSAYLQWDRSAVLSASPELFYEVRGRTITTRPIKGTRPRAHDPRLDAALAAELVASAKDEAELTMIVDLERNDLGRVCEFGSVRVVDPRSVASFPTVHHTEATVEGRLRPAAGPVDVVRALFPGGSITGAPKIRAMEIIDELEPCRRGLYTGAIGYWSAHGRSAFNVAIRTLIVEGAQISYHVGGGIVADSDPEAEYQETLTKGRGLFAALSSFGAGR